MYLRPAHTPAPRRGVILLVVIALLTLFAVVGISFVLYAQSRADIARIFRDSQQVIINQGPADSGQVLLAEFLRQLIYDVSEPQGTSSATVQNSALRGHSLARTMYGYNSGNTNNTAFTGVGRQHSTSIPPFPPFGTPPVSIDEFDLINYMWFPGFDQSCHDPERQNWRANPPTTLNTTNNPFAGGFNASYTYPDLNNMFLAAVKADGTVLMPSFHRQWITRKYFTTSLSGLPQDFTLSPDLTNKDDLAMWQGGNHSSKTPTTTWLKYLTLRPRPYEMNNSAGTTNFPLPFNGGDVKNLQGAPGGNDSIWLDLGYPVQTMADGRQYKPLFAPLIIDLDGRVNLNIHGNVRGGMGTANLTHASNQGWGPWEVNLKWVLNYLSSYNNFSPLDNTTNLPTTTEWRNLFTSSSGRYGGRLAPTCLTLLKGVDWSPVDSNNNPVTDVAPEFGTYNPSDSWYNTIPPFYSLIDYDGCNEMANFSASAPITIPSASIPTAFPTYNTGNGSGYGNSIPYTQTNPASTYPNDELSRHPLLFSFYQPVNDQNNPPTNYDNTPSAYNISSPLSAPFPILADQDMLALLYDLSDSSTLQNASTSGALCPRNFTDSIGAITYNIPGGGTTQIYLGNSTLGVRRRMLVTTRSFDVDQPAYTPWIWDRTTAPLTLASSNLYPTGSPLNYPSFGLPPTSTAQSDFSVYTTGTSPNTTTTADWRGNVGPLTNPYTTALADGRNVILTPGRLDLSRSQYYSYPATARNPSVHPFLNSYPKPNNSPTAQTADNKTGTIGVFQQSDMTTFNIAQSDRQQFAADLFMRLQKVTGAADLTGPNAATPGSSQYDALRWLAQLAVNIVDYIDPDDIITPFNWNPAYASDVNNGWVFGTELPRLLINEVYAEVINNPLDPQLSNGLAASPLNVNFSIELHNPFNVDNHLIDQGAARLVQNPQDGTSTAIYQVVIGTANGTGFTGATAFANVLGDPDSTATAPASVTATYPATTPALPITIGGPAGVGNYGQDTSGNNPPNPIKGATKGGYAVQPLQSTDNFTGTTMGGNNGFFVLASALNNAAVPGAAAVTPTNPTLSLPSLTFTVTTPSATNLATIKSIPPTVFLRRLACPWLPYQKDPTQPMYNPYVTVDYMESIPLQDGVSFTSVGANGNIIQGGIAARSSYGRTQPYVNPPLSSGNQYVIQKATAVIATALPQATFFQHNNPAATTAPTSTLKLPFFWPVHLDRQLTSAMELLEVSGFKPHEFTHQFVDSAGVPYQHRAPWFDNNARIYRIFEFLETWNRQLNMQLPGAAKTSPPINRLPGKININTIWDPEVFLALCDPQNGNSKSFTTTAGTASIVGGKTVFTPANQPANLFNPLWSVDYSSGGVNQPYDPTTIFEQLMSSRSPTILAAPTGSTFNSHVPGPPDATRNPNQPTLIDQPFTGLSFGAYPALDSQFLNGGTGGGLTGVNATLLRPLAVSQDTVTTTAGTKVSPTLKLASVNNALIIANQTMDITVAVDSGANEEFVIIKKGNITAGTSGNPTTVTADFYKPHQAGFGIGRVLAPIMPVGTGVTATPQPSMTTATGATAPYVTMTPPYLQHQLLNKIFSNVTTRSNVFAIWLTVGFFHVVDDTTNPPKLGREIGTEQGLNVGYRHHMFAIVDRTALSVQDPNSPTNITATSNPPISQGGLYNSVTTSATLPTNVQPGSLLLVDGGQNQETVMVLAASSAASSTTLTFRCNKAHQNGFSVFTTIPGNLGPQAILDLNGNKELIPYWTVLD